ncbi:MAG: hypothetical protein EU533_02255 [Promethearchaeota archaeon]|nr:MAG: hypothetical protein EU533_02255 [Candidatus Lokiarchaeota archaeon]
MSYIENKYRDNIYQIFGELPEKETYLLELLKKKSIKISDDIAKLCAHFNKNINQILKKYYPEIKNMDDKLEIKSILKFYFDLIDKLTDFIRLVENFQKIDEKYYNALTAFIKDKENLISGKYKQICRQELTAFYDQKTRDNLEKILEATLEYKSRQFFTMGPLEEEIKKIAKIAGASNILIKKAENSNIPNSRDKVQSIIQFEVESNQRNKITIIDELKKFIESKGFNVWVEDDKIITNLKLLPDN